jgi:hypothetical protein
MLLRLLADSATKPDLLSRLRPNRIIVLRTGAVKVTKEYQEPQASRLLIPDDESAPSVIRTAEFLRQFVEWQRDAIDGLEVWKIDTADFRSIDVCGLVRIDNLLETVTTLRHALNKGRSRLLRWETGSVIDLARLGQWIALLFEQKANAPVLDAFAGRPVTGGEIPNSTASPDPRVNRSRTRSLNASPQIHSLVGASRSHRARRKRIPVAPRT